MKSSKLSPFERQVRRAKIMQKRALHAQKWAERGMSFVRRKSTSRLFKNGKATISYRPYPHSSAKQRARYALQIASRQIGK